MEEKRCEDCACFLQYYTIISNRLHKMVGLGRCTRTRSERNLRKACTICEKWEKAATETEPSEMPINKI